MSNTEESKEVKYPLNTIYFYLTEGCNLACRHCWVAPKYQFGGHSYPALPIDTFRSIVEQAKPLGLSGVKLTGGEPLLHPQIDEILELVRTDALRLTVETNGVLCTPELAQKMAACENPSIAVSLDGANAETHEWIRGVSGCYEATLEGIRNLVKVGLKPQLIMSIMRHNMDQMEAVVRLAELLGAGSVKFNIIQPSARGKRLHETMKTPTIDELVTLGKWVENNLSLSTSLRIFYSHPMAFQPLGKLFGDDEKNDVYTCDILGIIGVLPNSSYALCGIGMTVPELVFGLAKKNRLENIWKDTVILQKLREGLPGRLEGICRNCLMERICLGNCIAQNYYRSNNLWEPFWYCNEAMNAGLFPKNRLYSVIDDKYSIKINT